MQRQPGSRLCDQAETQRVRAPALGQGVVRHSVDDCWGSPGRVCPVGNAQYEKKEPPEGGSFQFPLRQVADQNLMRAPLMMTLKSS